MSEAQPTSRRRRMSLSVRVSLLLMGAAILPLLIVVTVSEALARPALTAQANTQMNSDASTRVQLIDTYFNERLLDAQTITQVPTVQQFLATPPEQMTQDITMHALYGLAAGVIRDKHYVLWALFDPQGHARLYYPLNSKPQPHGQYLVPPDDLQAVTSGKVFISPVYYDPTTQKASVDIYAPIATSQPQKLLGFMRATLNIDYIWNIVQSDTGYGSGSYAFILDQNGIRIADSDKTRLFTAVATLTPETQTSISNEARYGSNSIVQVLADSKLASMQQSATNQHTAQQPVTFDMTPAGQSQPFQATQLSTQTVPWTYYVLSPVSTVTAVANQQLLVTSLSALAVLVIAALFGLFVGQRITRPILTSVEFLRSNSDALNALAAKQKSAAAEQMWVVDSSQVGLQSVQYYADATKVAAQHMSEAGTELVQRWNQLDIHTAHQALKQMITTAQYIEQAAQYQSTSNQKLATAIKVTTQVTEQLAVGATSATEAATQLQQVVRQLREVVGR